MLLSLGLLSTSISLSYFLSSTFADGVDSLDSSKLVAEPINNKGKIITTHLNLMYTICYLNILIKKILILFFLFNFCLTFNLKRPHFPL